MEIALGCPHCGSTEELASVEHVAASALLSKITIDTQRPEDGPFWDWFGDTRYGDSESTGRIECRSCGWEGPLENLVEELTDKGREYAERMLAFPGSMVMRVALEEDLDAWRSWPLPFRHVARAVANREGKWTSATSAGAAASST